MNRAMAAEFLTPDEMLRAIRELRRRGYRQIDAFTPYPVPGVQEALGLGRSRLGWAVLAAGTAGAGAGYWVQWYCNAHDYPITVGGRPPHAIPAFIPVTFEVAVLFAGVAAFVLTLAAGRLPRLWSPILDVEGFERASIDRFWIGVSEEDPAFNRPLLERDLRDVGAARVAWARGRER